MNESKKGISRPYPGVSHAVDELVRVHGDEAESMGDELVVQHRGVRLDLHPVDSDGRHLQIHSLCINQ